jgi:hypothetical protein
MMQKRAKTGKRKQPLMHQLITVLKEIEDFKSINMETIVKDWMTRNEIGMGSNATLLFKFGWCTKRSSPI